MRTVSVIIPNFNRADLVGQTINNLLQQTRPPAEIIVVDDGSKDDSVKVIQSFGSAVTLIQQQNRGPGAARNAGLEAATGDFVQFQDSDDLLSLNKLENQARILETTGADICFGPWAHMMIHDRQVKLETCVLQQALPPRKFSAGEWLLRGWFTVFQSLLFRRTFLMTGGRYETDVRYGEDMEYLFRLLICNPKLAFAPDVLTLYRVNSANNLSSDGGAAKNRRILDWAWCQVRMARQMNSLAPEISRRSRLIFFSNLRKHLRYLRQVPEAPSELMREFSERVAQQPAWQLATTELWLRLAERWRRARTSQRWMPGLASGPLTSQQQQLLSELDFAVVA